jgi:NADH-quinone oxidoreductase subunit L
MFFAAGVSAYSAAMLHLFTHAFFKALLFLSAGSVIHAMSGEQDMRKMGGIWRRIPWTYAVMWIGSLSLAGIPYFSGYFSKDTILEAAWAADTAVGHYAYWMGLVTAFLTAFYSWRLLIMTFHGEPRAGHEVMHHVHESPKIMLAPLVFLALGAIFAGGIAHEFFVGDERGSFWGNSILVLADHDPLEGIHHIPGIISLLPLIFAVLGIAAAYVFYMFRPGWPALVAQRLRPLYLFLLNKWYFDELYDRLFVRPAFVLGRGLWKQGDGATIDGLGPDGMSGLTIRLAVRAGRLQTGYLYHYAFAILIGAVIMVSWYLLQAFG